MPEFLRRATSSVASLRSCFYASAVFPKPRTIDSEPALYDAAIKILMRRAHSVSEMKKALIRRTPDEDLIQKVLARLKENGYIDDARYAKQFARQRTLFRKQGKFRVARELRARGVPDRHIEPALTEAAAETDEGAVVRQRIERKLRLLRGSHAAERGTGAKGQDKKIADKKIEDKKIASVYRSLLRAGFTSDTIRRELRRFTHEEIPDPDINPAN